MKLTGSVQQGFSIVELLATIVVIATGLLSVASFNNSVIQDGNLTRSRTEALRLAQDQVERMRNYGNLSVYDALANGTQTLGPAALSPSVTIAGLHNLYTQTWTVTPDATNPSLAKVVTITVTWPDNGGSVTPDTTISLSTVISNNNPVVSAWAMENI